MKIKSLRNVIGILTAASVISAGILSVSVFAANGSNETTNVDLGFTSFTKSWDELWTFTIGNGTGTMTIGFDTWGTDEDYVNDFGTLIASHYAYVINSDGDISQTNTASKGDVTGKADVTHTGKPVTFGAVWHD